MTAKQLAGQNTGGNWLRSSAIETHAKNKYVTVFCFELLRRALIAIACVESI